MALNSKGEFATKCGMVKNGKPDTAKLSVYIQRKKITTTLKGKEHFIDDAIEENMIFLQECQAKMATKATKNPVNTETSAENITEPVVENTKDDSKKNSKTENPEQGKLFSQKIEESTLSNEKTRLEIDKLRIEIAKKNGEVIPTPLAKSVVTQSNKSIVSAFRIAATGWLTEIAVKYNIDRNELSAQRAKLTEVINSASDAALIDSLGQIENIVKEYSEKKGVGEKE